MELAPLHRCSKDALTGVVGWLLQAILASLAFTCLILKRFCEPPFERRPWRIWFYDTSKQGMGALVMHMSNIFLASSFQGDPCTCCIHENAHRTIPWWEFIFNACSEKSEDYFIFVNFPYSTFVPQLKIKSEYVIHFLLDSSLGLFLIYIGIRLSQFYAKEKKLEVLNFGEYGKPPSNTIWLAQCGFYIGLLIIVKAIITMIIGMDFWDEVSHFILSPITNPTAELTIVMLVIPFFINALMFWVTDDILMHQSRHNTGLFHHLKVRYRQIRNREIGESEIYLDGDEELLGANEVLASHSAIFT